jgi:glutamyl-tRNA reductase
VEEIMALSTCNRVEVYGASRHPKQAGQQLSRFLAEFHGEDWHRIEKHLYYFEGEEALRHGFRVTASLDSMIVGEPQILGQVKESYRQALDAGTTGRMLNKFFHHAFYTAKRVRTETAIASHPVSVSYAAVVLAKQIFGDLSGKKALLVGAGKMNELAVRHLKGLGIQTLYITNRTPGRAQELAERFAGTAIPFDNFEKWLGDVDIVLTSTHAPGYLIDGAMVQEAMGRRKNSPMFFIDMAVPRDVSPEVNHLPNVFLYDVDDLGAVVEANKGERMKEAERAAVLLEQEVEQFAVVVRSLELAPTISSLSRKFEKICRNELEKVFQSLPDLDADARQAIELMAASIVKKVLHDPMVILREGAPETPQGDYSALIRKLFRLDEI